MHTRTAPARPRKTGGPFARATADDARAFREVLAAANYSQAGVAEALGTEEFFAQGTTDVPLWLHRTRAGRPLDVLIRLFLLATGVDAPAAEAALAPVPLEAWVRAGLVEPKGDAVRGAVQLWPYRELVLASDWGAILRERSGRDTVMGLGNSTRALASYTVRRPGGRALDLATGCGVQALLAARHCEGVVGTDLNPRALYFARLNSALNGVKNAEFRRGDLFEPVAGESFDLIVSNPPFVISPELKYQYRDGGLAGDELSRRVVRGAPALLREGGYFQVLCNWGHRQETGPAGEWGRQLDDWLEGCGCDVWVIRLHTEEATEYAASWVSDHEDDPRRLARRSEEWRAYYESHGIEAISAGVITMRRRSGGDNWRRFDDDPARTRGRCGGSILRGFAARDFLRSLPDDEALLAQPLRLAPDARLRRGARPSPEGWAPTSTRLTLTRGLCFSTPVDAQAADLAARCDGTRPLGKVVSEMAAAAGRRAEQVTPACLSAARDLVERGFLLPPGNPEGAEPAEQG